MEEWYLQAPLEINMTKCKNTWCNQPVCLEVDKTAETKKVRTPDGYTWIYPAYETKYCYYHTHFKKETAIGSDAKPRALYGGF